MSESVKVSVIIPCYNQGQFLLATLGSVEDQTCLVSNVTSEYIVVDDGSTEAETILLLDQLASKKKIILIRTLNQGLATARNTGLQNATGEFIQFLDSDDLLYPDKWRIQLEFLNQNLGIGVAISDYELVDEQMQNKWRVPELNIMLGKRPYEDFLFRWETELCIPIHCGLFRRAALGQDPFLTGIRAKEDWLFWLGLAQRNIQMKTFPNQILCAYRQHGNNMSRDISGMIESFLRVSLSILIDLEPQYQSQFIKKIIFHIVESYLIQYRRSIEALILKREFGIEVICRQVLTNYFPGIMNRPKKKKLVVLGLLFLILIWITYFALFKLRVLHGYE